MSSDQLGRDDLKPKKDHSLVISDLPCRLTPF